MSGSQSNIFSIRSLQRLDEQISRCTTASELLTLHAKRSCALARHSYLPEAKAVVLDLRSRNQEYDPQLSGWIIFAEGLIQHFETLDNNRAKDKFKRAFLVSQMAGERELAGTCAAWVAHCEFVSGRIKATGEHLIKAFAWSEQEAGDARGRASMVLADAFNATDQIESARRWFHRARAHASSEGDIAMQNVILFNMAAYGVARLNLNDCLAPVTHAEVQRAAMEVASAANLNMALGADNLSSLVPIMQAELLVVQQRWDKAIENFDHYLPIFETEGQGRLIAKGIAQRAWCKANLGDEYGAKMDLEASLSLSRECVDDDDLAILHARLSGTAGILEQHVRQVEHKKTADLHLDRFRIHQSDIRDMLQHVVENIGEK